MPASARYPPARAQFHDWLASAMLRDAMPELERLASENRYHFRAAFIPESMNPRLREYFWSREDVALCIGGHCDCFPDRYKNIGGRNKTRSVNRAICRYRKRGREGLRCLNSVHLG